MRLIPTLLAASLLAAGCSSVTVVVPPAPDGSENQAATFTGNDGRQATVKQGDAYYANRAYRDLYRYDSDWNEEHYFGREREYDRQFAPAEEAMAETLRSQRSYIVLLESPDGRPSRVIYQTNDGTERQLDHAGKSLTLDGDEFHPNPRQEQADFGPARTQTNTILAEGLPVLPHSYVALLQSPYGDIGSAVVLQGRAKGAMLDKADEAVLIDGYSNQVFGLDKAKFKRDFGAAVQATPPHPATVLFHFKSGSTQFASDSARALAQVIDEIGKHPGADITVAGYADTVGGAKLNDRLSLKRADAIAKLIRDSGKTVVAVDVAYFGKTDLAVATPDNTPELLNRRVEVTIR
jgi:peptidoglycan-associated lipoprotein